VFVAGSQAREYFSIIREALHDINGSFKKIEAKEMVPCHCKECVSLKEPYFYEYVYLRKLLKKGKTVVNCTKSIEDVSIDALLSGIKEIEKKDVQPDAWDVFISYSTKDEAIIDNITENLKQHGINYWIDKEQIKPGDEIIPTIERGIKNSNFILPCFSRNQLESNWCRVEYETVLNGIFSGTSNQGILPLVLDNLNPRDLPLFIRGRECVQYSDKDGYKKILRLLKS
jgi:hypothetical protein